MAVGDERSKQYKAKYDRICIYCGSSYKSKRRNGNVCYEDYCQRRYESDRKKRQYQMRKARANNG